MTLKIRFQKAARACLERLAAEETSMSHELRGILQATLDNIQNNVPLPWTLIRKARNGRLLCTSNTPLFRLEYYFKPDRSIGVAKILIK